MKALFFGAMILLAAMSATSLRAADARRVSPLEGSWTVQLRLEDKDPSYTKPMVIKILSGNEVTGEFYEHAMEGGHYSKRGKRECVAFQTSDNSGPYEHSACVKGKAIEGMSWSTGRKFLLLWTAERAK
jgi:hypothetical protein